MARSISSVTSSNSSSALSIKASPSKANTRTKLDIGKPRSGPVDKRKRLAANARERKRMDLLNKAFDLLRGRLNDARNKSKYDVLVQAKEYIQALARICADHDREHPEHPSAMATGRGLKTKHSLDTDRPLEPRQLESPDEPEARRRLDLTIASVPPPSHWQQPIQSPASSSDCCLSPMSLPESLGSSGSPHCSSHPQHQTFHHNLSKVYPNHLSDSKSAFLYHAHRPLVKQEAMSEPLPNDFHQIYHPHFQSLFQTQKQTPIN